MAELKLATLCGTHAFECEMFLGCQFNSEGTMEPWPSGRMLYRKSISLGNNPSVVWSRQVTSSLCHIVSVNKKGRITTCGFLGKRRDR